MATKEEIDAIIDATDIVSLVSEYVKLEKRGKNYVGLCPFHSEDTPSFSVNPEKKIAHCFGCGGGGNPIQFLKQIENITFNEAVTKLANRAGIKISTNTLIKEDPNKKYYKIMQTAKDFYKANLAKTQYGVIAKKYLADRGLDEKVIEEFEIGLSPEHSINSLYKLLMESKYLELDCLDCGLISNSKNDYHDFFVKRIMFPIFDEQSNVIGFSARKFNDTDPKQPKYINSLETKIFQKNEVLFNLNKAKGEILKKKRVILHEGQMDVIASYRSGLKEAVCSMGTALTMNHVLKLKKYTTNVVICFDGDNAGINASLKAIKMFKDAKFNIHLVLMSGAKDPDEFVLTNGKDKYLEFFENNIVDEYEYVYKTSIMNKNLDDAIVLDAVKKQIFDSLARSNSSIIVEKYLNKLKDDLNVSFESVKSEYDKYLFNNNLVNNDVYNEPNADLWYEVEKPKKIIKKPKANYQSRLFIYARSSKKTALYIDSKLNDRMEALTKENQILWITLINGYYEVYEEFNDELFMQLLGEDSKKYYIDMLESLSHDRVAYTSEDLADCLSKLSIKKYDVKNDKLSNDLKNTNDISEQARLISLKFMNKKKQDDLKRRK